MLRRIIGNDPSPLTGIALAATGYSLFAIQDALVKWLVADYSVPQILFVRSVIITAFAGFMVHRGRYPSILKSPHRRSLLLRGVLILCAWLSYYSATKHLGLAEITTMYFSAPVMVVVLSIFILKEKVGPVRWIASIVGFSGVILAANPSQRPDLVPAMMVLFAGFCWAWSVILVRLVSRTESTFNQMMATSFLFAVVCGLMLPWVWITPDAQGWMLLLALGAVGLIGQFLLYEGFRYAPASALAPIEYSGIIWAFLYGYLFWNEMPTTNVFVGAFLVAGSSIGLVLWERRSVMASRRMLAAAVSDA